MIIVNDSDKPLINIPNESTSLCDLISLKQEIKRKIDWKGGDFHLQIYLPDFADFANLNDIRMIEDKSKLKVNVEVKGYINKISKYKEINK